MDAHVLLAGGFFCVTFCIVAFQGFYMNDKDVVILAGSRVAAICVGVVFALLLACTIFPMSASGKVVTPHDEQTHQRLCVPAALHRCTVSCESQVDNEEDCKRRCRLWR
jgi:Aluminium activated malate transporter